MKKSLIEYVDLGMLQALQDSFSAAVGVSVIFIDPECKPITTLTRGTEFCQFLNTIPSAGKECVDCISEAALQAVRVGNTEMECHAGRRLLFTPIKVNEALLGVMVVGIAGEEEAARRALHDLAVKFGMEEQKLNEMIESPPRLEEVEAVKHMSDILADTLSRLCLQQEKIEESTGELNIVSTLAALLSGTSSLSEMLNEVARHIVTAMNVKACTLRLLDQDTRELRIAAVGNLSDEYLHKGAVKVDKSPIDAQALNGHVVYIEDILNDPRVLYPEDAKREGLASGLAIGMVYRGVPVGVVHIYTSKPYRFTPGEISMFRTISAQAAAAIANARLYEEALRNQQFRQQVRWAGEVQRRMLPSKPPVFDDIEIAAGYVPYFELGGDFYDFIDLPSDNIGLAIADVSGKGVPASLLMASTRSSLLAHSDSVYSISDILRRINLQLCRETLLSEFVTMFYGVLDRRTGMLTYVNAGHDAPILIHDNAEGKKGIEFLRKGGLLLGIEPTATYDEAFIELLQGDLLFMYTDGLTDAVNFQNESFGKDRLIDALLECRGKTARQTVDHVIWQMRRFIGLAEQFDDVSLVAVRITGRAPTPQEGLEEHSS
jgi:sigma-B regulation protein RsbU (phosphoserine phosphatase)